MAHPKFEIPADPHGKARYESAKLHAEAAEKAGKSSEEIHAVFKQIMDFNPATDLDKIPKDEAHINTAAHWSMRLRPKKPVKAMQRSMRSLKKF